ncbi:hypothetical protein [Rhizobium sp. PAMB 3182]
MLPPVRVEASSAVSAKAQGAAVPKTSVVPAAVMRPEIARAITHVANVEPGQLNILSFGSSDPFPAALRTIATQLGDVLGMTRGEAETDAAFAQRLAAAIRNLPAASRAGVEKMITQSLQTIQLQTLLEVLDSPAGVQAARVAALLEGGRGRDGEAVTRNVLESYHQNEGEDADAVVDPARRPLQTPGEPPFAGSATRPATATPAPTAARAEQQGPVQPAMAARADDEASALPANLKNTSAQQTAAAQPPSAERPTADAQALRQRLERAYGPESSPAADADRAEPQHQPVANQNAARNAAGERHQTLQILKGWTEVVTDRLIANAIRDPEQVAKAAELVKALSQAELPKASASAAARPSGALPAQASAMPAPEAGHAPPLAEDETALMRELSRSATSEAARNAAAEPQAQSRDLATNASTTRQALLHEGAQTLAAQAMVAQSKDGVPFAQVGYLPAQDDLPEEKKRRRYAQPEGEAEGQAGDEQAAGEQHGEADEGGDGERRTPRMISDEDGPKAGDDVEDPMFDLYQRMAGLV